ncbi:hypothetical protein [Bacillus toyonensis]|uniref:hypothetical protein n=1 Tax=Bacillus toyonensis TaxID=155322 RepID=UPI00211D7D5A|nr:hypothetical protein [Bacillus toyonensis]
MSKRYGNYRLDDIHSMAVTPTNEQESQDYRNALATGNYPLSITDCETVGLSGGCGVDCHVYLDGKCQEHEEMIPELKTEEDKATYQELYVNQ